MTCPHCREPFTAAAFWPWTVEGRWCCGETCARRYYHHLLDARLTARARGEVTL